MDTKYKLSVKNCGLLNYFLPWNEITLAQNIIYQLSDILSDAYDSKKSTTSKGNYILNNIIREF